MRLVSRVGWLGRVLMSVRQKQIQLRLPFQSWFKSVAL
jgi:hypothetical protein